MEKLKDLWFSFTDVHTKSERIWLLSSVVAAISALILLLFVPTLTVGQAIIVTLFSVIIVAVFWFSFTSESYMPYGIISSGWCVLSVTILWMFPISVFWALIPLGIIFFVLANINEAKTDWITPIFWVGILAFWFIGMQNNVNAKNYLKSNPEAEIVVLSNYDDRQEVFFIEGQDEYLKFKGFGVWRSAEELKLKKGDTVKIIRHPNNSNWVIKISR